LLPGGGNLPTTGASESWGSKSRRKCKHLRIWIIVQARWTTALCWMRGKGGIWTWEERVVSELRIVGSLLTLQC
jgi:hypothetical protein